MAEEMKNPESAEEEKPESSEAEKQEKKKEEPKDGDAEKKASDDKQADEKGEGAESEEKPEPDEKGEGAESEEKPEPDEKAPPDASGISETDRLKAENLTLKTQLEALKIGFKPDCVEDAVVLAESIVKRDGSDITAALQAVAKKYPDWKSNGKDNSKGGFKVGADTPKDKNDPNDSRLDAVFGIRKKK